MTAAVAGAGAQRADRCRASASWALAARLARREVRRRKGRTALVVALVAIPVIAMTIASVFYRTVADTPADQYTRSYGTSDLALPAWMSGGGGLPIQDVRARLPEGTREVTVNELADYVESASDGTTVFVRFSTLPLDDSITAGIVDVSSGRVPASGSNEVLLSPGVADALGVGVGDTLQLAVPAVTFDVVGLGHFARAYDDPLMIAGRFDFLDVRSPIEIYSLIDLPDGVTIESVGVASPTSGDFITPANWQGAKWTGVGIGWLWVGGALALTVMGIIIAAAFATSARRQLVTLGQLASNGADARLLRRTLALQGAWSGLIGGLAGVGIGLALVLPQHELFERIINRSVGPMTIAPLDVAIIALTGAIAATVAAFVPARTITKVPVLNALNGRRPLGAVPRWLVPIGVVLFIVGVALLALVPGMARSSTDIDPTFNVSASLAVGGGLGVLFGMCCVTPAVVAVLGPIGERLRGTARLAARSIARVRTRSSAIVTAISAAGALTIAGGTVATTSWDRDGSIYTKVPFLQDDMVSVQAYDLSVNGVAVSSGEDQTLVQNVQETIPASTVPSGTLPASPPVSTPPMVEDPPAPTFTPVPADLEASVGAVLPDATRLPIRTAQFDPGPQAVGATTAVEVPWWTSTRFVVADAALLDLIGLSPTDRAALGRVGVLSGWEGAAGQSGRAVTAWTQQGVVSFGIAPMTEFPGMWAYSQSPLVTPAKAAELGLVIGSSETLFISAEPMTEAQRGQLQRISDGGSMAVRGAFAPPAEPATAGYAVNVGTGLEKAVSRTLIDALIVAGALLFILAVVAVGLALSAAESRDERDVLLAVGAPPGAMRRVSAQKAVLLSAIGGVLAVPTGFLPVAVVLAQLNDDPIRFPWLVALGCVVVVPTLVGAVTLVGSAIAQRVRPIRMSTLVTD